MSDNGQRLSGSSRLIRFCRKRWADGGIPSVEAFKLSAKELEQNDPYLSFFWLERLCEEAEIPIDCDGAIRALEECPPLNLTRGDLWIVLSCERIENAILSASDVRPSIEHKPVKCICSHVGVGGFDTALNCDVATELAEEVKPDDTHLIDVKKKRFCQA